MKTNLTQSNVNTFCLQYILQKLTLNFSLFKWKNLNRTNKKNRGSSMYDRAMHGYICVDTYKENTIIHIKIIVNILKIYNFLDQWETIKTTSYLYVYFSFLFQLVENDRV